MTPNVLIDSDILSMIMRRQRQAIHRAKDYLEDHPRLSLSVITAYEVIRGLKAKGASTRLDEFVAFCRSSEVVPLTMEIVEVASDLYARLKRQGELLDHADILIAATAISQGCSLATNNTKHFSRISELAIENWLT
ncbi:MAG: type II toxin-antitoxin system VapC family toxin [Pirellulales bacterium]|nr:type II toxin-antitoxin system VapC family toxin [Pirellulales bacterium]